MQVQWAVLGELLSTDATVRRQPPYPSTLPSLGPPAAEISWHSAGVFEPDRKDPYIGQLIAGRYQVLRKLNQGGMGAVYLAMQHPLERPVALKLLLRAHADDPLAARRFEKEARAVSRLTHPHIVTLFDFGSTDKGQLFIAMEYLQGKSLRELLALSSGGPGFLPWDRALHIVRSVTSALVAAHGAGIIHRDLKPENIMLVERNGEVDFPLVLDFGLAKSMEPDTHDPITQRDIIPGTPAYMSPERANGIADDPRSDLYSLGALWFELLTGHAPFVGESSIKVILRHIHEQPAAPSQANPRNAIPQAIDALVLALLAKHPDARPPSAAELLETLDSLARPRGWHVSLPGAMAHHSVTDKAVRFFTAAVRDLDELEFFCVDALEDIVPLVQRKSAGIPTPQPQNTLAIAVSDMPSPLLLTKKKAAASSPPTDVQAEAPVLLMQPKRPLIPRPLVQRITGIEDVSSHLKRAKTARDIGELCVAFLASRFDRALVANLQVNQVLAATGIADGAGFLAAAQRSSSMREMWGRRDAFYGATPQTPDWLTFFRAALLGNVHTGGATSQLPGALLVATLKRDGAPAFLFYGDHKDLALRSDVSDAVTLLREAANAFSLVALG